MIIQVNSTITDNRTNASHQCDDQELKQKFENHFCQAADSNCNVEWLEDGTVELKDASPMSLHNFTLQAEALGKQVKYHKKTIIEII